MPGTITIGMELEGPVRLNVSSKPAGSSDERPVAELYRLGLEHFGFNVEDLEAELERLGRSGIRVVLPLTEVAGGTRLAYIEGPDDVLIELVQRPCTSISPMLKSTSTNQSGPPGPTSCWKK